MGKPKNFRTCIADNCNRIIGRTQSFCQPCLKELSFMSRDAMQRAESARDPVAYNSAVLLARKELQERGRT